MLNKTDIDNQHWNGTEYRKISFPQNQINDSFLSNFHFDDSEKILDIGCGDGTTTRKIANKVPKGSVLGIDASDNMIESAIQATTNL